MYEKDVVVRNLLKAGQRQEATNLYHYHYRGEVAEVRAAIEEMAADDGVTGYYPTHYRWENITDQGFRAEVEALLRQGNLIATIRRSRTRFPGRLIYAKQAALAWRRLLGFEDSATESVSEEPAETFDLRWRHTIHTKRQSFFGKRTESRIEFRFELHIGQLVIPDLGANDAVSLSALIESKASDGEYRIFTCGGCQGFDPIEVIHIQGRTLWYNEGHWNIFAEADYKAAIGRIEAALIDLKQGYPNIPIEFAWDE
jgi:hypothetical protein